MPHAPALRPGFVYLDGMEFRVKGPITPVLTSTPPPKLVVGDNVTKSDNILNELIHRDGSLGIGLNIMTDPSQANFNWFGRLLSYRGQRTLPEEVVTMGPPSGLSNPGLEGIFDYGNVIYGIWNGSTYAWNDTTSTWGSAIQAVGTPTSITNHWGGTAEEVWLATGSALWRITNPAVAGAGYTDKSAAVPNAKFVQSWDNKVLVMDTTGTMVASGDNGATWPVTIAKLPIPPSYIQKLGLYYDVSSETIVYAATRKGTFALDYDDAVWIQTKMGDLPLHPDGGKGFIEWRNDLYYFAGLDGMRYTIAQTATLSDNASLNRLDGLPTEMRGSVVNAVKSMNELFVLLDSSVAGSVTAANPNLPSGAWRGGTGIFATPNVPQSTGYSSVLGWNGVAWRVLWRSLNTSTSGSVLFLSQANSKQRLIWGTGGTAYSCEISRTLRNPVQNPVQRFQLGPLNDITPWFDAFTSAKNGLAVVVVIDVANLSAGRTAKVEYGLDRADAWYPLYNPATGLVDNVFTADGQYERVLDANVQGVIFDSIRFNLTLQTNDATSSPKFNHVDLYYAIVPRQRWGFNFRIAIEGSTSLGSEKQQLDALKSILPDNDLEPKLVTLQYHDDSTDTDQYRRVLIYRMQGMEYPGKDYVAEYQLSCAQVYP